MTNRRRRSTLAQTLREYHVLTPAAEKTRHYPRVFSLSSLSLCTLLQFHTLFFSDTHTENNDQHSQQQQQQQQSLVLIIKEEPISAAVYLRLERNPSPFFCSSHTHACPDYFGSAVGSCSCATN